MTDNTACEVVRVLRETRHRIEGRPLVKGWGRALPGKGCPTVTLSEVAGESGDLADRAMDFLVEVLPTRYQMVTDYVDAPDTTLADVLALFDRAITCTQAAAFRALERRSLKPAVMESPPRYMRAIPLAVAIVLLGLFAAFAVLWPSPPRHPVYSERTQP